MEKAIALKEDGLQIESDVAIDTLIDEIHNIASKYDDSAENGANVNFDKSILPQEGQIENRDLIDDKLRALVDEFNVKPIDLIGHVLEFRIDWKLTNLHNEEKS
ncbi:MAG: hypothetical protein NC420_01730 [Eubacterium sp.]|nr:hypothetical protein [Eubacterium sp.]